ncbi:exonuclease domain-containing protein [Nocardia sp. SYP-A9097]|uniref:exonuclease domain-containing protein n=1 Tax=Nocardia sp. SYP-A9097 TaxID=2663237 RepID=UPI001E556B36|nr:exonuclease domain-containing protein [Nocardia sp. SYP-A9097]
MPGLSFAALDVETANSSRGSICAVGVAIVRDGVRLATHSWLCRPPRSVDFFSRHNIRVHGISPTMVADQPVFAARFPEVLEVVADLPLVAHNAGFDSSAIREACRHSEIPSPSWDFTCTLTMSRRHLDLDSYRLPAVADALDIPLLTHHNAAADATAAADIVLALAARTGIDSLSDLERLGADRPYRTRPAAPRHMEYPARVEVSRPRQSFFARAELVMPEITGTDPAHPLHGQTVVFTGDLTTLTRQEAWNIIAACGATPAKNVTKRTTCLVIGDAFTGQDPSAFTTTKAHRAAHLRTQGQQIEILDEQRFLATLKPVGGESQDSCQLTFRRLQRSSRI